MNISEAIKTLDGVIPSPDNKMVDFEHFPIAVAWKEAKAEIERLKADNQVLIEALQYMTGMYGFKLSMTKLDDEIEYSCNHYVTDRGTWITLKKAENIINWWE